MATPTLQMSFNSPNKYISSTTWNLYCFLYVDTEQELNTLSQGRANAACMILCKWPMQPTSSSSAQGHKRYDTERASVRLSCNNRRTEAFPSQRQLSGQQSCETRCVSWWAPARERGLPEAGAITSEGYGLPSPTVTAGFIERREGVRCGVFHPEIRDVKSLRNLTFSWHNFNVWTFSRRLQRCPRRHFTCDFNFPPVF